MLNQLILFCRPGFEKECAAEIMLLATQHQFPAYIQTNAQSGYVFLNSSSDLATTVLFSAIEFKQLIFTRQWFACSQQTLALPESNRLPDIVNTLKKFEHGFYDVELSYADTNEGKKLSKFCQQFKPHLLNALNKNLLLSNENSWRLHLFFTDSQQVKLGISPRNNHSPVAMGMTRLKMPKSAPSRSTLKLDEAISWFLTPEQQAQLFSAGLTAVDLGAAPGGWSWQLVQRGCMVTAIDNGEMDKVLMKTLMVEHLKTDAFTYRPMTPINWLVCDMAERPLHVSRLVVRWFVEQLCEHAIFNLKLPMTKRFAVVQQCIELIKQALTQASIQHSISVKHLYHNREEVTVCVLTKTHQQ